MAEVRLWKSFEDWFAGVAPKTIYDVVDFGHTTDGTSIYIETEGGNVISIPKPIVYEYIVNNT